MPMSNAAAQALGDLIFLNTDWANIGDAGGLQNSAAAGSFYVALHTADPTAAGDQTSSEATYTGYAREAVARTGGGWARSGQTVSNVAAVQFDECTAGSNTVTYFSIGVASSGASQILAYGALSASRSIAAGDTPLFNIGELDSTFA